MVKNASSGRPEWPAPQTQRVRRRRESKVAYQGPTAAKFLHRHVSSIQTNSGFPPGYIPSRHNVQIHQQSPQEQPSPVDFLDFYDLQNGMTVAPKFEPSFPQQDQAGAPWLPMNTSYTLPTHPPNSPIGVENGASAPLNAPSAGMYDEKNLAWQTATITVENIIPDQDVMSESRWGSFDSFNSLALTINTVASSVSDGFACPTSDSSFESPQTSNMMDLYLPGIFTSLYFSVLSYCHRKFSNYAQLIT